MINFRYLAWLLVVILLSALIYVSVLGENNLIEKNVESFFNLIKEGEYQKACNTYGVQNLCSADSKETSPQFNLIALELALLKHYNLFNIPNYSIVAEKDRMWFPYISSGEIKVNVKFSRTSDSLSDLFKKDQSQFINDLITVKRVDGYWRISEVNISENKFANEYRNMLKKTDISRYIEVNDNTVSLRNIEIDIKNTSTEELRITLSILKQFENLAININK